VIADLQAYLADAIASGTPAKRKAAIEALVAEVRITDHGLIPVFRIPSTRPPVPRETYTAATEPAVRTMLRSVGLMNHNPNRPSRLLVQGSEMVIRPIRAGRVSGSEGGSACG
jgi:hypothetical protein